jgi:hypothetical protein
MQHGRIDATGTIDKFARNASLGQGTAQSIPHATATKIQFDTVLYDNLSLVDAANYRFTSDIAGKILVTSKARVNSSGITIAFLYLYKNGSVISTSRAVPSVQNNAQIVFMDIIEVDGVSDYLEIFIRHEGTSSSEVLDADTGSNWVRFQWIGE